MLPIREYFPHICGANELFEGEQFPLLVCENFRGNSYLREILWNYKVCQTLKYRICKRFYPYAMYFSLYGHSFGCASMPGWYRSLSTLLRDDNPELTRFRCVCYSLHLAACKASECLPIVVVFLWLEKFTLNFLTAQTEPTGIVLYAVLENSMPRRGPRLAETRGIINYCFTSYMTFDI